MPKPGTYSRKSLSSKEWHKELLLSWLFQTCFKLQAVLDRRFLHFGVTFQEAAVLTRCVEAGEIMPGRLALRLGRDKGKITRFVDRLEAAKLVKRQVNPRDRRYSIIKPTPQGKRLAERIASTFDHIRKELFVGVLDSDIQGLDRTLPQLHRNAVRIGTKRSVPVGRRTPRIGEEQSGLKEETFASATPPSVVKSGGSIAKEDKEASERSIQADDKTTESQTDQAFKSTEEVVLSR